VLLDNQTDYSLGLNDGIAALLQSVNVKVVRESTTPTQIDFSALIAKLDPDVDVIFMPLADPAAAQLFAAQMSEQGKKATLFGGDSIFSPTDFHAEGAYVSSFAPDIKAIAADAALIKAYTKQYGGFKTTFGPPVYAAVQVELTAIDALCASGTPTRAAVAAQIGKTQIRNSILGGTLAFDAHGDVKSARFRIFKIEGGQYKLLR